MSLRIRQAVYILMAIAAFVLLIIVVTNSQSPESLMSPPEAVGDYKEIQKVIEQSLNDGIILKAPNKGEYTTAITFADFNNDSENDALAFYRLKADDTSSIYMSVLLKDGNKWKPGEPVKGKGNDILEFSFADLNYDSYPEIVVGWNMFDSKDNNTLCVYSLQSESDGTQVSEHDSLIYTEMLVSDVCGEGKTEILLIKNTFGNMTAPATATVYEMVDGRLKNISSADLVSSVEQYKSIYTQKLNAKNVYLIDGVLGKNHMITEVLYWDAGKKELVNPLPGEAKDNPTYRNGMITCADINHDAIIEIPFFEEKAKDDFMPVVQWKQFKLDGFENTGSGIATEELLFMFPESWEQRVAVKQKDNMLAFYDTAYDNEQLFELITCDIAQWNNYSGDYEQLTINYGTIIGVKFHQSDSDLMISKSELKEYIVNNS